MRPGDKVVVEVKVNGPNTAIPTGRITIKEGSKLLADGTLTDGLVKLTLPVLALGVHELKVDYLGAAAFDASSASALVNVSLVSGKEFTISAPATVSQVDPVLAQLSGGKLLAAWTTPGQDGSGLAVYGRMLTAGMTPLAKEFQINSSKTGDQVLPSATGLRNGDAVVAWRDGKLGLRARVLAPSGSFRTAEIDVDAVEKSGNPVVSAMAGGFVAVWPTQRIKGVRSAIVMRRFTSAGKPIGKLIRVDGSKSAFSFDPTAIGTSDGGVVVAWIEAEFGSTGPGRIRMRGYDKNGNPRSSQRLVSTEIKAPKSAPSLAQLNDGSLVVVWATLKSGAAGWNVRARRFLSATGAAKGVEFDVPAKLPDDQMRPKISAFDDGGYIVVWQSPDSIGNGIFARSFDASGKAEQTAIRVNRTEVGDQVQPAIAAFSNGKALAIWTTGRTGIIAQALALE